MHPEVRLTIDRLLEHEDVQGFDPFGFRPEALEYILPVAHFLYRNYFRVEAVGLENIPQGRVLLIANHSGQLPFDGAMIATSLLLELNPPRIARGMVEKWVPTLPFVSMIFTRAGQTVGTPANARALLNKNNAVLVFPEGAKGISKTIHHRYQLQKFGLGFMRLALETNTPIVPIGVVGAEEQLPSLYNVKQLADLMDVPAFPLIPNLLLPLPTKYHLYFGKPLTFRGDPDDEDRLIQTKVDEVKSSINALLKHGLSERRGIFY